jgi:hypothetical protein
MTKLEPQEQQEAWLRAVELAGSKVPNREGSNAILLDRTLILSYRAIFSIKTVIWVRSHP